jgi:steroid delta-isomerase-like uncharacterized protein
MSIEENKVLFRRIPEEVINTGRLERAADLFAADYVEHVPLPPDLPPGVAGFQQFFGMMRAAFPDLRYTVDDLVGEGDKVTGRITAHGTNRGDFMGIPATGKAASWNEIHVGRFAGGKLVEHWAVIDQLALLRQLGVVPAPAAVGAS